MRTRRPGPPSGRRLRAPLALLAAAAVFGSVVGLTAGNTVAASRIDETTRTVAPNDFRPALCVSNNISVSVVTNGAAGTASSELLLGTSGIDVMNGEGGNDCVVGGGGADTLEGGAGTDACVGGGGTDIIGVTCEYVQQD